MSNQFSYDDSKLLVNKDLIKYDLVLRKPLVQILGDSATGKTMLVNVIKIDMLSGSFNGIQRFPDVYAFNERLSVDDLRDKYKSLIIIDRADIYLNDALVDYISEDKNNIYLIFARRVFAFGMSPNHYGEFIRDNDGVIRIKYKMSIKGW